MNSKTGRSLVAGFLSTVLVGAIGCQAPSSLTADSPGAPVSETVPPPTPPPPTNSWRSSLYPANWAPGFQDSLGRFFHDFSYAGYHMGRDPIPTVQTGIIDVTQAPYNADATGSQDATVAVQAAIDETGRRGGGVVFLPAGTYKVSPQGANKYALSIHSSRVVLRGAGMGRTFIFNDSTDMREKDVIRVGPDPTVRFSWFWMSGPSIKITAEVRQPTREITLESVATVRVGDWLLLFSEATEAWVRDHGMQGKWDSSMGGVIFYRQVTAVNAATHSITIDVPTRYWLLPRDNARVSKVMTHLEEVGIEDLSMGMRQVNPNSLKDQDYDKQGTVSYQVHQAHMIFVNHTVNGWIRRVSSYRPSANANDYHILSNGLKLSMSRNMTVQGCDLRKSEYQGAGGNGYLFIQQGSENLMVENYAEKGRHNYDFAGLETTGNVILRSTSVDGRLPSDFHMYLSPANLLDNMTMDRDYISAVYRDTATPKHGHGTTQSVIWRTKGLRKPSQTGHSSLVESQQYGFGYVIGTSGTSHDVSTPSGQGTEPGDFIEGVNQGEKLLPASLYEDQLAKRLAHP